MPSAGSGFISVCIQLLRRFGLLYILRFSGEENIAPSPRPLLTDSGVFQRMSFCLFLLSRAGKLNTCPLVIEVYKRIHPVTFSGVLGLIILPFSSW